MATTIEPNMEALEELYAWAAAQHELDRRGLPSEWDQGTWGRAEPGVDCGTACCIAGRQVLLDGGKFLVDIGVGSIRVPYAVNARMPEGDEVDIRDYAAQRLGLTEERADALFEADNGLGDLRTIIDAIGQGEQFLHGYEREDFQ